jgi:hypothetical protein
MTERPPWFARNAAEREAMVQWMHRQLDELQAARLQPTGTDTHKWLQEDGPQIYYAERGRIEPLRKKYPHLAPFLFAPPKRKQVRVARYDAITTAVWAVEQIGKIWKNEYKLKKRPYRSGDQILAVEIAALWMEVDPDDIKTRMKPSGPSGKKLSRAD